ncbi:transposase [Methylobacterium indicum]|uniref:transposase n=1 Tax=Methylobacterium indicum TaxID=1775910 RepID=UPI003CC7FCA6
MPDAPAPIRVGIDGWAIRKGSHYGTIGVDLDRHHVIDLLPKHRADAGGWLERHSDVELVARDRSTEYTRGASIGAHQTQQVADRWHLLINMRQPIERWLHHAHARLRNLPPLPGSAVRPARRDRAFARSTPELEAGAQSRMRWRTICDEVRRRHASGEPLLGIARAMGLARAMVRKYATAEAFPVQLPHGAEPSLLDPHAGCTRACSMRCRGGSTGCRTQC